MAVSLLQALGRPQGNARIDFPFLAWRQACCLGINRHGWSGCTISLPEAIRETRMGSHGRWSSVAREPSPNPDAPSPELGAPSFALHARSSKFRQPLLQLRKPSSAACWPSSELRGPSSQPCASRSKTGVPGLEFRLRSSGIGAPSLLCRRPSFGLRVRRLECREPGFELHVPRFGGERSRSEHGKWGAIFRLRGRESGEKFF